jgi:hypothetical protein
VRAPESRIYDYARTYNSIWENYERSDLLAAYIHDSQEFVIIPIVPFPLLAILAVLAALLVAVPVYCLVRRWL